MSLKESIIKNAKKACESLGKNNKATYTVMAVAVTNGIFKPITSLTDKKEAPETKKYAALREFLTEVVAVPTYWACGELAAWGGSKLFRNPVKVERAKTNLRFLGVCTAALAIIPAGCSLFVKPFTDLIFSKNKKVEPETKLTTTVLHNYNFKGNYHKYSMNTFTNRGGLKI
ncbi:hypothetical protein IJ579_00215 [bacterium]|nr:hypothetical protein [bacterium]